MSVRDVFSSALQGVLRNKARSIMTSTMVLLGVGSVITLMGMGSGAAAKIAEQVSSLGASSIEVFPGEAAVSSGRPSSLTAADVEALKRNPVGPALADVAPVVETSLKVSSPALDQEATAIGTTSSYFVVKRVSVIEGRALTEADNQPSSDAIVLDEELASRLFPSGGAVGQMVTTSAAAFRVVGITRSNQGSAASLSSSSQAFMGIRRLQAISVGYARGVQRIVVSAKSPALVEDAKVQVAQILIARAPDPSTAIAPSLMSARETLALLESTDGSLDGMLNGLAVVSLLVSAAGVTNVMSMSVRERKREIGIRKALGATNGMISSQFLIEAVVISVIGGAAGVLSAWCVSLVPTEDTTILVDPVIVASAIAISITVGIVAGTIPAFRAARMEPVQALRIE